MDVQYKPVAGPSAQDFALKEVVVDQAPGTEISEGAPMLLHGAPKSSAPHNIAVEKREKGILPGLLLKEADGSQVENMHKKLASGPIKFSVPSHDHSGNSVPLTVTCNLKKPSSCMGSPSITVTVENPLGETVETEALGGFWVTGDNGAGETHCILDFREQRMMDYQLKSKDPASASMEDDADYQVEKSTLRVADYIMDGVTHLEKASHDDGYYNTHDAVLPGGMTIPTALLECDFDEWNSNSEAAKMLVRSIGGGLCHASKNPELDLRTMLHLLGAIGVGSAGFILGDEAAALAQRLCGFDATSFLGTSSDNPTLEKAKYAGLVASLVTYFGAETTKDALGVSSQFVTDPKEKRAITAKMWALETFGAQIVTMLVVAGSIMAGDYAVTGNTDASNPPKLFMDLLIPQTVAMGVGSAIQSWLISNKGFSPAKAWLFFAAWRLMVFRGMALGVQSATTALFTDKQVTGATAASIVIANVVNEFVMDLINGTSYLAGKYKTTDGTEEQLMAYAKQQELPVNKLNAFRLGVSQSIDMAPKSLWGAFTKYCLNRSPDSTISKVATTPFVSALFGVPDDEFLRLQAMQKDLQSRKTEASAETRLEAKENEADVVTP
ncbi:hypothetical protein [Endozoicomonas atrinae]|uniref:hypothetical protein n=1 Tax=Endozoicomonas atrinae TaxID=1333660 RepID=UPI003AFFD8D8